MARVTLGWMSPPGFLDLQPHQVDVWRVFLDLGPAAVRAIGSTLSADESQRAVRFHFPKDRERYKAAHGCLRNILARYLGCQPGQLDFSANRYGKPALNDRSLEFNLSHSGDFALIAVARNRKVGIDLERVRSGLEFESIASRCFSQVEVAEFAALPPEQRAAGFFNGWTCKEAYIKAQGLGLSMPLDSFDVSLAPDGPALLRATRPDPSDAARWTMLALDVNPGYAAALAVEGREVEFRLWDHSVTESSPRH